MPTRMKTGLNICVPCFGRLIEQAPAPMTEGAVQWAKLVVPLVVHSASKVRLRAAAALEMGLPLILEKQEEVAAMIEPMMATVGCFSLDLLSPILIFTFF